MILSTAILFVLLAAIFGNRILAVLIGLWYNVPVGGLLSLLVCIDLIQIPLFYWLCEAGHSKAHRLPVFIRSWLDRERPVRPWVASLGGVGVMTLAALPTFGGGMLPAIVVAYGLKIPKRLGYAWLALGSLASYGVLYLVLGTIVDALHYFQGRL